MLAACLALLALALAAPAQALAPGEASFVPKTTKRPRLTHIAGTLTWTAVDPTGYYLLKRRIGRHEPEYALVAGTQAQPPAVPRRIVHYAIKAATGGQWSREVQVTYPRRAGALPEIELVSLGSAAPTDQVAFSEKPARTSLTAEGETLTWEAVDPAGTYLLERRIGVGAPEYAIVKGLESQPPPVAGETVAYRVKPATAGVWSRVVPIAYGGEEGPPEKEREPEKEKEKEVEKPHEEPGGGAGGPIVHPTPTGPPAPAGGWHVALADGFGAAIGTAPGRDNFWYPNEGCCNPAVDQHGNNRNELEVYNSSQVHVGPEGLELVDKYAPGRRPATEGWAAANYVSGAVQDFPNYEPAGYSGFTWLPGHGETWAFECYCRLPVNTGEVDPGWWSMDWSWTDEFDFFEEWGWGSATKPLTGVVWLYETAGRHLIESNKNLYSMFDPSANFHRYTTVINANNTIEEYIDGVRQSWVGSGGLLGPPPRLVETRMSLILSNALREKQGTEADPAPNFQSGTRTFTARSIAVYEDGAHAGKDVTGGGVAPGTTIAK